ncbi:rod shape-determining protein MreC [Heliophilum fasciatum]|nr:rod shape-determining protein MreC [Heliophilum fasciatum]
MHEKKLGIAVVVGLLLGLVLLRTTGGEREATGIERYTQALLAPLQKGATIVTDQIGALGQSVVNYKQIKEENEALRRENGELRRLNSQLTQYQLENLRLRDLLAFKQEKEKNLQLLGARVIARDPESWFNAVTIDRGSEDGVAPGMVLINNDGVIGHVTSVNPRSAHVLLIIDKEGPVPGMLQTTREPGIVEARNDVNSQLQMIHLRRDAAVQEGQLVITSGLGAIYPRGLRIGYITGSEPEPNGLTKRAMIRPAVDFQRLEEVFVIQKVISQEGEG